MNDHRTPHDRYQRDFATSERDFSVIGGGEIGGKAKGLIRIRRALAEQLPDDRFPDFRVGIPQTTVIATDFFDAFVRANRLEEFLAEPRSDERIALEFQKAELPVFLVGDLLSIVRQSHLPLAIRSSSLLEDAKHEPFAGIYETKMIPNNQPDAKTRFQKLTEAIKFVYASTFFQAARDYRAATGHGAADEKMAIVIQEVVGRRHGDRFYPDISGVARSYNFYPFGHARPQDGVVNLALGLGKTIVDGGVSWTFSPSFPKAMPPYNSLEQLLKETQNSFWAVNMGRPPAYDPIQETEYLVQATLADADYDNTLRLLASTYDGAADRLEMGVGGSGPRVLTFAPLLVGRMLPLSELVKDLLEISEADEGAEVEIEFAVSLPKGEPARFGFLQVRPMVVSDERIDIGDEELADARNYFASRQALGNGRRQDVRHVVYLKPETFDLARSRQIAGEVGEMNQWLRERKLPYLLIGMGRWGSADPWLGVPVNWSQISQARAIVELMPPHMHIDLSQGSHFFHNLNGFQVSYFSVQGTECPAAERWSTGGTMIKESAHVRCIELREPLEIKVDGRTGRGVIR